MRRKSEVKTYRVRPEEYPWKGVLSDDEVQRLNDLFARNETLAGYAYKVWDAWEFMTLSDQVKSLRSAVVKAAIYGYFTAKQEVQRGREHDG